MNPILSPEDTTKRRLESEAAGFVYGLDASKWQPADDGDATTKGDLSWAQAPDFIKFVIFKISEANFRDRVAAEHIRTIRLARPEIKLGGYHFMRETHSARIQAETYARYAAPHALDIVPNCDLEGVAGADARWPDPEMAGECALEWMQRVDDLTGQRCALYSSKRHLDAVYEVNKGLALELADRNAWLTGYWDNWPRLEIRPGTPKCYESKHGRAGKIITHQWSSGRFSKKNGEGLSRPVPEVETWRPGHRIDHNRCFNLDLWLVDSSGQPLPPSQPSIEPAPPIDYDEAWASNMAQHGEVSAFFWYVERMGVSGWTIRDVMLAGVAAWQLAHGLEADGKVGPGTIRKLDES